MARSKAAKHKQAKKTAAKLKATAKMEHAESAPTSPQKQVLQQTNGPYGSETNTGVSADDVGDNKETQAAIAAAPSDQCIMSELLRLSESLVRSIVHTLIEDYGLTELSVGYERYLCKDGEATNVGTKPKKPASKPIASNGADAVVQRDESAETQRVQDELVRENKRLRSLLDERDVEKERLSQLVVLQQSELHMARSRVAQLDAFMVHEVELMARHQPATNDMGRLVQGLQHQYALRESHFASIERALALEIQMWKEKYAQSENRLAATYGEKRPNASSEDFVHQSDSLVLENELAELKEKGGVVKQRLEDCDMLLQTLVDYNKEQREADCLQINGLISDVEDLSSVKTAMMDYARTAMMRSHKLEDLCRALQAQRKESVQSNSQRKHQQQLQQHMHKHGIKGLNSQLFATMESVFASSVAMDDTSGLSGDQMSLDDAMGDLQPLMSQMAMAFSAGNAPKQQVMVGESPRIIRTPRRRSSNLKKPNLKPGKQSQFSLTNSLPNKDMSTTLNADATKSPTIKQTSGFVGAPSAEFTFSTP